MLRKLAIVVVLVMLLTLLATPLVLAQQEQGPTTPADLPTTVPTVPPNCVSPPPASPGSASPDYIACSPATSNTGGSSGSGDTGFQQYGSNNYCLKLVDYCIERKLEH